MGTMGTVEPGNPVELHHPLFRAALSQEQHSMMWMMEAVTEFCALSVAEMGLTLGGFPFMWNHPRCSISSSGESSSALLYSYLNLEATPDPLQSSLYHYHCNIFTFPDTAKAN